MTEETSNSSKPKSPPTTGTAAAVRPAASTPASGASAGTATAEKKTASPSSAQPAATGTSEGVTKPATSAPPKPKPKAPPAEKPVIPAAVKTESRLSHTNADAGKELTKAVKDGRINETDIRACRAILKEHAALKAKVDKLKSLLGRSAQAQRESKIDLEATQKRLHQAIKEIEKLTQRLDKIQSRPTHMDLLMDFQTNFDKALLSVGQTGGEDTAPTTETSKSSLEAPLQQPATSALDSMLMQELGESKERIDKLESLNSTLSARCIQLEASVKTSHAERDDARKDISRYQMEIKLAQMEAEQATRALHDKVASLEEMQMEIDLVTKANAKANVRAARGAEAANSSKTDREKIIQLEAQVQALKEWALASAESKRLMQEKVTMLENKLRKNQNRSNANETENILFKKSGSLVIGAGDMGNIIVELGEHAQSVDIRFVVLRWKFDFTPAELTIDFNILKGKCSTAAEQKKADFLVKDRVVKSGAGGETEGAFNYDNACTLLWSNKKSWVRPRTVKFAIDVIALK